MKGFSHLPDEIKNSSTQWLQEARHDLKLKVMMRKKPPRELKMLLNMKIRQEEKAKLAVVYPSRPGLSFETTRAHPISVSRSSQINRFKNLVRRPIIRKIRSMLKTGVNTLIKHSLL